MFFYLRFVTATMPLRDCTFLKPSQKSYHVATARMKMLRERQPRALGPGAVLLRSPRMREAGDGDTADAEAHDTAATPSRPSPANKTPRSAPL